MGFFGNAHRHNVSAAKLIGLEALRANVMLADNDLNITYLNQAPLALMKEAEADLKKELPRFDVDRLIGSNIDIFHKNPAHQRKLLAVLEKPHSATIWIGARPFDLLVTPLMEAGKRIGFAVEWSDAKQRLLNIDYAGQVAAISRSQAVIEFQLDGTIVSANENFLRTLEHFHGDWKYPSWRK